MRDILPVIYQNHGVRYRAADDEEMLFNCVPHYLNNGEIGAAPREEVTKDSSFTANADADRGRGITTFGGQTELYLDQDTYYYNGGSQDLTATTGNGYAGNTGFNEEYTTSFVRHLISGVENLVMVNAGHTSTHASANHGNVWYVADGSTAPSSISDANMPGNNGVSLVRGGASLDGYFFVGDITGKVFNSALNDITTWSATNFITNETEPDIGIYVGKHHNHVISICTRSISFFYNAGNTSGTPLARRSDVAYRIGCYFPNTIVENGDEITFVGTDHAGHSKVYRLVNFQLTEISTPKIDERIRDSAMGTGTYPAIGDLDSLNHYAWGSRIAADEYRGYILTNDFFWTYYWDELTGVWSRWTFDDTVTYVGGLSVAANWQEIFPIMSFNGLEGSGSTGKHQFINGNFGHFGSIDNDAIDDLGEANAPDVFMKFPRWDGKTDQKKRINWIRVLTKPWASTTSIIDPVTVNLKFAKYDRAVASGPVAPDTNYTSSRSIDLNVRGAKSGRLGTGREWAFIIDWPTGHGPISVVLGLEIDYEIVGE